MTQLLFPKILIHSYQLLKSEDELHLSTKIAEIFPTIAEQWMGNKATSKQWLVLF